MHINFQVPRKRYIIFFSWMIKLYAKNEKSLNSLVQTVRIFSDDIDIEFGIDKCAILVLKRGKITKFDGI